MFDVEVQDGTSTQLIIPKTMAVLSFGPLGTIGRRDKSLVNYINWPTGGILYLSKTVFCSHI